ncbi:MAG: sialate O-acetylesterase [Bacteroidales bacterium]|nr:sialate O-acetylesterase [Bacteroidales bacterium]
MTKKLFLVPALLLAATVLQAKVEMPSVFSDNMVLQQKANVAIWGTATGKKLTITASWTRKKTVVTPGEDGKWFTRIETPAAGGPYEICFNDGEKTILRNVLIGEVWLCSGQSNMQMPLRGWRGQPIEHATDVIMAAKPQVPIRLFDVKTTIATKPSTKIEDRWKENTPEALYNFSATAYFFALKLHEILGIPVGVITADRGGSPIEAWMSREILENEFPGEFNTSVLDTETAETIHFKSPAIYYNGMLSPIKPYTFKGIIWYQGEDNRMRPEQYTRLQPRFVKMLREEFENPDAPFYFVQIAPYKYTYPESFNSGYFYEAQQKTLALIPRSGMVPTVDLGSYNFIHPPKKMEVGYRLAMHALVNDYGITGVNPVAPTYKSVKFEDGKAIVTVDIDEGVGLLPAKVPVSGFDVAGEDRVFHPATATAFGQEITIRSDEVSAPVAVRYCFRNWCEGTLFSVNSIPLLPFRTDSWNDL